MVRYKGTPRRRFCVRSQKRYVSHTPPLKKKVFRKHRKGFRVRQEIRKQFFSNQFAIPKKSFTRLCREILLQRHSLIDRFESNALEILQRACEYHLTTVFRFTNECAMHDKRVTIYPKDMHLANSMEPQTQTILSNNPNVSGGTKVVVPRD